MFFVLSPAKTLDFESAALSDEHTQAAFLNDSSELMPELVRLKVEDIRKLMGVSEKIAALNVQRFSEWSVPFTMASAKQAIFAFKGDVYAGIAIETSNQAQLDYIQSRVLILSGLYGILRPLDLMMPYRLEMGTKFPNARGKNLYEFWGHKLTAHVNTLIDSKAGQEKEKEQVLVNLASNEYYKSLQEKHIAARIVTPVFKDLKKGKYKIISFYAKKARGLMVRFAADHHVNDVEGLKDFNYDGYKYCKDSSSADEWVFTRDPENRGV